MDLKTEAAFSGKKRQKRERSGPEGFGVKAKT